jgi:hypothetical protein
MLAGLRVHADQFGGVDLPAIARRMALVVNAESKCAVMDRFQLGSECGAYARSWSSNAKKAKTAKQKASAAERMIGWIVERVQNGTRLVGSSDNFVSSELAEMDRTERATASRRSGETSAADLFSGIAKGAA